MKNLNEVQVGDEVLYQNSHYGPGKIVKVEGRTPTGRLRIGDEYFEPNSSGNYAVRRGRDRYTRANLQIITPEIRRRIIRHEAIEYLANQTRHQWEKLSDIDLLTIKHTLRTYGGQNETNNTGLAPTDGTSGNNRGTGTTGGGGAGLSPSEPAHASEMG